MDRNGVLVTGMVCVTALLVGGTLSKTDAGDLNPPPGPVAPTMLTLSDLAAALTNCGCEGIPWAADDTVVSAGSEPGDLVASGSGVVHGFWMKQQGEGGGIETQISLYNGPAVPGDPSNRIGIFRVSQNAPANQFFELNVGFQNGLYARRGAGYQDANITVLYRAD